MPVTFAATAVLGLLLGAEPEKAPPDPRDFGPAASTSPRTRRSSSAGTTFFVASARSATRSRAP